MVSFITEVVYLFPVIKPYLCILITLPSLIAGGFQVELLDPEDRMKSRLTPGDSFVSDDPTQQSLAVSLPSEECVGCAVGDHQDISVLRVKLRANNQSMFVYINRPSSPVSVPVQCCSIIDQTDQTGSRVGSQIQVLVLLRR